MRWAMSRFRSGDVVEVRSREEILRTLDEDGCVEGMPFMPEMLQYCGQRVRVASVAHKTCETAHQSWQGRRLNTSVHLENVRCDGSAHGGCQAACNVFWKDAWLRAVDGSNPPTPHPEAEGETSSAGCSEDDLVACTRLPNDENPGRVRYSCQATMLFDATQPLAWWNPLQYMRDITSRNFRIRHVLRAFVLASLKLSVQRSPRGYRLLKGLRERVHRRLTGRELPDFRGTIRLGEGTPQGRLNLQPGELVRIKSKEEIEATLNVGGANRGLYFDVEMSPFCGRTAKVRSSVTQIIDEKSGQMREMKHPCIILEDVACNSEYSSCRLMCPRSIYSYWRELWLERVGEPAEETPEPT